MRFIKRLMEIKEKQLEFENDRTFRIALMQSDLREILKVLKGGKENGKQNRNKKRDIQANKHRKG